MADKTRIGFVGSGGIARAHAEALQKVPDAHLVAVTDVDAEAAGKLAESTGAKAFPTVEALISDAGVDALYILVPPFARGKAELAAVKAKIPMFLEKPVGLDLGISNEIAAEIAAQNLMTFVGYMTRYRKSVQRARQLMAEEPGIMAYGGWWGGTPNRPDHWWPDSKKSGGQFHEQATHTVDLARYFFGKATEVYAAAAKGFVKGLPNYSMDDAVTVAIRFESGAIANLMASVTSNAGGDLFMNVHSMNRNFKFTGWEHSVVIEEKDKEPESIAGEPDIFAVEGAVFVDAVRRNDRSKILSDYADGLESAKISLAANQSIATGSPIELD